MTSFALMSTIIFSEKSAMPRDVRANFGTVVVISHGHMENETSCRLSQHTDTRPGIESMGLLNSLNPAAERGCWIGRCLPCC